MRSFGRLMTSKSFSFSQCSSFSLSRLGGVPGGGVEGRHRGAVDDDRAVFAQRDQDRFDRGPHLAALRLRLQRRGLEPDPGAGGQRLGRADAVGDRGGLDVDAAGQAGDRERQGVVDFAGLQFGRADHAGEERQARAAGAGGAHRVFGDRLAEAGAVELPGLRELVGDRAVVLAAGAPEVIADALVAVDHAEPAVVARGRESCPRAASSRAGTCSAARAALGLAADHRRADRAVATGFDHQRRPAFGVDREAPAGRPVRRCGSPCRRAVRRPPGGAAPGSASAPSRATSAALRSACSRGFRRRSSRPLVAPSSVVDSDVLLSEPPQAASADGERDDEGGGGRPLAGGAHSPSTFGAELEPPATVPVAATCRRRGAGRGETAPGEVAPRSCPVAPSGSGERPASLGATCGAGGGASGASGVTSRGWSLAVALGARRRRWRAAPASSLTST